MKIILYVFLFLIHHIPTVHPCKHSQQIRLQPYTGTAITYPENYPTKTGYESNLNCSWEITAREGYDIVVYPTRTSCGSSTTLKLYYGSTTSANTSECLGCSGLLGYCNDIVQTKSSDVLLVLSTLSSFGDGGFEVYFMAVETSRDEVCDPNVMKLLASRSPNFITSPGFPSEYPSNADCSWLVEPAVKESETRLVFQFRSLYLEPGYDACIDYVRIDELGEFCEQTDLYILKTTSSMPINDTSAKVSFKSDGGYALSGFVLAYYIEEIVQPCSCQHGGTCMNSTCICSQGYKGPNCENVRPGLVLQMMPQFDFLIRSGEEINLQCSVINAESLIGLTNGRLIWQKDGKAIVSGSEFSVNTSETNTTLHKLSAILDDSGRYTCLHSTYPDPVNASVYINVTKPECINETSDNITWNAAIAGTTEQELCPENQIGTATRVCNTEGKWETPNLVNCTDEAFVNASKELDSLIADGENDTRKLQETVNNTLQTIKKLTSKASGLSSGDISSSLDILDKIVDVTNMTNGKIEKKAFFEVVDNVLSTDNSKSWATVSEKTIKSAGLLLKSMDRLSEIVIKSGNVTPTNFNGDNIEVTINRTNLGDEGIIFPDVSSNSDSNVTKIHDTFLQLPMQSGSGHEAINYVAVIYKTITDFLPKDSKPERHVNPIDDKEGKETSEKKEYVNSEILSLSTQTDLVELSPPLRLTFNHISKNNDTKLEAICVWLDSARNIWTKDGCSVNSSSAERTVCQCNHLTNFAILMRPYASEKEDSESLKTLSATGIIISIVFTVLTFMIYVTNWKHIKSDLNVMLLNLCGSLVVSYIIFIVAVEKTSNEILCTVITAVIHYLFLVTFFCMLGMGIYYFMSITVTYYALYVANNFKSKSRIRWFLIGGWGIPLVIAASTVGGFWGKDYHLKNYCWLSMESGALYLFIVPVCFIAVLNIIIIVTLIRVLFASSAMTKSTVQRKAASGLRSLGTLLPVLGVNWIFGVLAVNERAEIFQFVFIITNSLQGLFIFISHVLLNKKLMQSIKSRYPILTVLTSSTESNKKDTPSVSRTQSAGSDVPMVSRGKKMSKFAKFSRKTAKTKSVQKSDSFLTEKTDVTLSEVESKRKESKALLKEEKTAV